MRYCTKCILNEQTPFISFDENGICNYCHEQDMMLLNSNFSLYLRESHLIKMLDEHRNRNNYDCIIAVSGGKDSTAALFVVKEIYKLNPLVITFSNPFVSNRMIENVYRAVNILDVDWRLYHYNEIKKGVEYFLKSPYKTQISICDICDLFLSPINIAYKIAKDEGVKVIFTGSTIAQRIGHLAVEKMPQAHQKYYQRYDDIMEKVSCYFRQFDELKTILPETVNPNVAVVTSPWYYMKQDKIKIRTILDTLKWHEIEQNFPKGSTNCQLSFLTGYLGRKYGIANYDIEFSRLIRLKKCSREEAIKKFSMQIPDFLINELLTQLNMNIEEL